MKKEHAAWTTPLQHKQLVSIYVPVIKKNIINKNIMLKTKCSTLKQSVSMMAGALWSHNSSMFMLMLVVLQFLFLQINCYQFQWVVHHIMDTRSEV
jgi:hypothetical protein